MNLRERIADLLFMEVDSWVGVLAAGCGFAGLLIVIFGG
jgi:hypothetical protein